MRFAIALLLVCPGFCQTANTYRFQLARPLERLTSPEIYVDRQVTFRLRAPHASKVELLFSAWSRKPVPMSKDEDGVWQVTVGPLEPEIYTYAFQVDGIRMLDLNNPNLKTGGRALDASELEIPAAAPRFDQLQQVPRGVLHVHSYVSSQLKINRSLYVYVPPQAIAQPDRRLPVLYLRHGNGDTESNWSDDGRAGIILDNLLARDRAVPMYIVMTNGYPGDAWANGSSPEAMNVLARELFDDVMPLMERTYKVLPGRENRAIAGLSMGGGQAFTIGLRNLDKFAWVAEFSSGLVSDAGFSLEKHVPGFLDNAAQSNGKLRLLYLGCGSEDERITGQQALVQKLKDHNIHHQFVTTPGAHEWKVWRHLLADLLPRLFRSVSS